MAKRWPSTRAWLLGAVLASACNSEPPPEPAPKEDPEAAAEAETRAFEERIAKEEATLLRVHAGLVDRLDRIRDVMAAKPTAGGCALAPKSDVGAVTLDLPMLQGTTSRPARPGDSRQGLVSGMLDVVLPRPLAYAAVKKLRGFQGKMAMTNRKDGIALAPALERRTNTVVIELLSLTEPRAVGDKSYVGGVATGRAWVFHGTELVCQEMVSARSDDSVEVLTFNGKGGLPPGRLVNALEKTLRKAIQTRLSERGVLKDFDHPNYPPPR